MDTVKNLLMFLTGAAAGAVAALLLAPESGEKARGRIRAKAAAAAGMAKEKILEGLDDLEEALEEN